MACFWPLAARYFEPCSPVCHEYSIALLVKLFLLVSASYLACGNTDGIIKVFLMKIFPTNVGIPDISIAKAYSFCDDPDGITVDCMTWYRKVSCLVSHLLTDILTLPPPPPGI